MGALFGLSVSTSYIALSCLIAWWGRKLVDKLCPKPTTGKVLLLEAIATWELCAACFELIIIADNYGVSTYGIYLFLLTIWWSRVWGDSSACPYTHVEELVEGSKTPLLAIAIILAELAGGALTSRFAHYLWSLEVSATHRGRAYEACTADLQVPALFGALIEGAATCICRVVSRVLGDIGARHASIIDAFVGTSLVVAAFNYSGGYYNPALATALKLGCDGHGFIEFFLVYWLGATLGAIGSVFLYRSPLVQERIKKITGKAA